PQKDQAEKKRRDRCKSQHSRKDEDPGSFVPGIFRVYLRYGKFKRIAHPRICHSARLGGMARGALRRSNGRLAQNRQKGGWNSIDLVCRSVGERALLW